MVCGIGTPIHFLANAANHEKFGNVIDWTIFRVVRRVQAVIIIALCAFDVFMIVGIDPIEDCADDGYGIAVDHAGNAYITGLAGSPDFPVYPATNGAGSVFAGVGDVFVAKLFPRNAELRSQSAGLGEVTILWPYGLPNFELQTADDLGATNINWATLTNTTPTVVGDDNSLTLTNVSGNQFFRLRRGQ